MQRTSSPAMTLQALPTDVLYLIWTYFDDPHQVANAVRICTAIYTATSHFNYTHLYSLAMAKMKINKNIPNVHDLSHNQLRSAFYTRKTPPAVYINSVSRLPSASPNVPSPPTHATGFCSCSVRSYTDSVQFPGTPIVMCATRRNKSPLTAFHLLAYTLSMALSYPTVHLSHSHSDLVGSMAAHPTRPLIATGSIDGSVKLWSATLICTSSPDNAWKVSCISTFRDHQGWAAAVSLSDNYLASAGPDNHIFLYALDAPSSGPIARICVPVPIDTPFGIFGVSISPSSRLLSVMDLDGTCYVYQQQGQQPKPAFKLIHQLMEPLSIREARHFDNIVRQSFGCLLHVTDYALFVNSIRLGHINVFDPWVGTQLYTLSIPTTAFLPTNYPPRSRTVHSFRYIDAHSTKFLGLLVTTCAGDVHLFNYLPMERDSITPARVLFAPPASAPSEDPSSSANEPPPTHLQDSHDFDLAGSNGALHKIDCSQHHDPKSVLIDRFVHSHHECADNPGSFHDLDESVAADVWIMLI